MEFAHVAARLLDGYELSDEEARWLMRSMISGETTDAQVGAALALLAQKGVTGAELASFAGEVRAHAAEVPHEAQNLIDTCGTGGGAPSFNISTAAAIIASAAGANMAKHGNRAVTSSCGSADVLEALGVRIGIEPERLLHLLDTVGIAFMFAPKHHPALRHVGKARKELGFRTVFNMIGPLANPAGAARQLVGVYDPSVVLPMAEALARLGVEKAYVVHGHDGLDEVSPVTTTHVAAVFRETIAVETFEPEDFGMEPIAPAGIAPGESIEENAALLHEAISDANSVRFLAVLPSSAVAIHLAGLSKGFLEAAEMAREAVRSGKALQKLRQFAEASQGE
jgi:anthranilate phosphoribosyltransferase